MGAGRGSAGQSRVDWLGLMVVLAWAAYTSFKSIDKYETESSMMNTKLKCIPFLFIKIEIEIKCNEMAEIK